MRRGNRNAYDNRPGCGASILAVLTLGLITATGGLLVVIWRAMPAISKFLFYFVAWPFLLFEHLWNLGGNWRRAMQIGLGVAVFIGLITVIVAYNTPTPVADTTVGATATMTATPGNPTATDEPVPPTHTAVPATATMVAAVVTDTPLPMPATDTSVPVIATDTAIPVVAPTDTAVPVAPSDTPVPPLDAGPPASTLVMPAEVVAAQVSRVVDGDTARVMVNGEELVLRFIGIDTPETKAPNRPVECYGPEASTYTTQVLSGQQIYLEYDPSQGRIDRYARDLVYVWLADGRNFNEMLIANGYAFEYTYDDDYKYQQAFQSAQRNASQNQRGLWSPSTCNGESKPLNP